MSDKGFHLQIQLWPGNTEQLMNILDWEPVMMRDWQETGSRIESLHRLVLHHQYELGSNNKSCMWKLWDEVQFHTCVGTMNQGSSYMTSLAVVKDKSIIKTTVELQKLKMY